MRPRRLVPLLGALLLLIPRGFAQEVVRLDLFTAESLALANSTELNRLAQEHRNNLYSHRLSLRSYLPQVKLNYSDSRSVIVGSDDSNSLQMGVSLSQPLFNGGRTVLKRRLEGIQLGLKGAEQDQQRESLRDQVWQVFHSFITLKEKLRLQRELKVVSDEQFLITQTEHNLGSLTDVDLLDASLEVQTLEIQLLETETALEEMAYKFKQLLGLDQRLAVEPEGELSPEYRGIPLVDEPEMYADLALQRNPSLRSLQFNIQQAKAQLDITRRLWLPNISLRGSYTLSGASYPLQESSLSAQVDVEFLHTAFPVTVTLGINNTGPEQYGRNQSSQGNLLSDLNFLIGKDMAALQLASAVEQEKSARTNLRFSIGQQAQALQRLRQSLALERRRQEIQKQRLTILNTKLQVGEIKRIEFMKAQIELYNQEISLLETVQTLKLKEREFEKTLGLELGGLAEMMNREVQE